ncbi:MAG: MFS transporter [Acidimicrobiales bacterium]
MPEPGTLWDCCYTRVTGRLPGIMVSLGLDKLEAASLATITLGGAVVGGIAFGILSDYLGRVKMLTWSIVLFAAFTGLTALSHSYAEMAIFRFAAGAGLGGEFGIGMTLAAEAWPASMRARATSFVALGWQAGVLVAALVAGLVIAAWGWRALFAIGVVPGLLAFMFRRTVPEPAKFESARRDKGSRTFPLRLLIVDGPTARASAPPLPAWLSGSTSSAR